MAGGQERALRRRIKSVQSTKKITKAMELIAASQILRSQARITANRPYRDGMARIILEAARGDRKAAEKLLGTPATRERVAVLAIVADRGLAGPYNTAVLRATERLIIELKQEQIAVRLFTCGKKAQSYFRFRGQNVEHAFLGLSDRPTFADAQQVAHRVAAPFVDGDVDQLLLVSTRYKSAGTQVVEMTPLLPLPDPDEVSESTDDDDTTAKVKVKAPVAAADPTIPVAEGGYTEFEPDVETLLGALAPKAVESEVFTALLEGAASFYTAQQRAMAAASENADELVRTLSRIMNRARQDAITTEIMEIVGGAEALRHSKGA